MELFGENSRYTPEALELHEEIEKALNPIFKKWNNKGHSLREISHIVTLAAVGLESMLVLIRSVENMKKKRGEVGG